MLTKDIIQTLRPYNLKVIADSEDQRLIQEIHNAGIRIYPVGKGAGSVIAGIEKVKEFNMFVTERSYNLMNELRKYVWDKDKDGRYINQPAGGQADHLCDAFRYYVYGVILGKIQKPKDLTGIFTH